MSLLPKVFVAWWAGRSRKGGPRALIVALTLGIAALIQSQAARAEGIYAISVNGIWVLDSNSGAATQQLWSFSPPYPASTLATMATRPSDGMIFYLDAQSGNPNLWRFDPSTPLVPPVLVGAMGVASTGVVRMGFDSAGTLFAMNTGAPATLWTVDPATGGILTATTTSGVSPGGGGDICRQPGTGTLYLIAQQILYTITQTGIITQLGTVTGLPGAMTGCAFTSNGVMYVSPSTTGLVYTVNIGALTATALPQTSGIANIGDLATAPARVTDLGLSKSASTVTPGNTVSFTLTVTNKGPLRATTVNVRDLLPAGLTFVSATPSQGTYNPTTGIWVVGTLNFPGSATLTINASVGVGAGSITNTAEIFFVDQNDPNSTPNNNVSGEDDQASVSITRSPDLRVAKTSTTFAPNQAGTYTITVDNLLGSANSVGTITVIDNMPAGITITSTPTGTGWTCTSSTTTQLNCTSITVINAGASGNPITVPIFNVNPGGTNVSNVVTVSGGGEPANLAGNNTSAALITTVCAALCPDLTVTKTTASASFTPGTAASYTITVNNAGGLATSGTITVTDTLPTGLVLSAAPTGVGWTCAANQGGAGNNTIGNANINCTSVTVLNPSTAATVITVPVTVASTAVTIASARPNPTVSNTATVSGGGEPPSANANNTGTVVRPINVFDLTVAITGPAQTTVASPAGTYIVTVGNAATFATTGTNTVTITLPTGFTFVAAPTGTGWTCTNANPSVCTSAAVIAGLTTSANTITYNVNVGATAVTTGSVTTAVVSNPAEPTVYNDNNTANISTLVPGVDLVVTKTHTGNFVVGSNATYNVTVTNIGGRITSTNAITLVDTLPTGLTFVSGAGTGWNACTAAAQVVTCVRPLANTIAAGASAPGLTITVAVTAPAAAAAQPITNTVTIQNSSGNEPIGNNGNNTDTDATFVYYSPVIAKSFLPATIVAGTTSVMTLRITAPAGGPGLTGVSINDTFPANMFVDNVPNFTTSVNCGTPTIASGNTPGATTISVSNIGPIAAGQFCDISVNVTANVTGTNTTQQVQSTNSGIGNAASATLTVTSPANAQITKATSPNPVGVGRTSVLTFTIVNKSSITNDIGFTDTMPANMVVATPSTFGGTCASNAGAALVRTGVAGTSVITVTGVDLAAGATCTVTINVTSSVAGSYQNNTARISALAGGLTAPNLDDTFVVVQPTLTKAFSPTAIPQNGVSTLTFTLTNGTGNPQQSGLGFTETLPVGLKLFGTPAASQCDGTVTSTVGAQDTITLANGGFLSLSQASCTITAQVTSATANTYTNLPANITSLTRITNGIPVGGVALLVQPPPQLVKSFLPIAVGVNQPSSLTFTINNSTGNPVQSGLAFTDTLPAGLELANSTTTNTCNASLSDAGNNPLAAGATVVKFTGGSMIAGTPSCAVTVNVRSATPAIYTNGTANISALAGGLSTSTMVNSTVTVLGTTLTKAFGPATVSVGVASTLTFTIANSGSNPAQTGLSFTDNLPAGLTVAATPTASQCGGTVAGTIGSSLITFTGGSLAAASVNCTVVVSVVSNTAGSYINNAGNMSNLSVGMTNGANATLAVRTVAVTKSYSAASIPVSGSSTLTFTLTNGAGTPAQSNITFTDTLTVGAGLTITGVTALTGTNCSATTPTFNATSNPSVTLTGASMAATATTCTFTVTVQGNTAGAYLNSNANGNFSAVSAPTDTSGASSTLTVYNRATLSKAYGANPIAVGANSTLTFTITNGATNPAQSGLAFTDTFPVGTTVTAVSAIGPAGCGGTPSFTATTVAMAGGTMTLGTVTCTFTATVQGTAAGIYVNDTANARFSLQGGGLNTAATTATLTVFTPPTVTKTFTPATIGVGGTSSMVITVTNPAANPADLTGVIINDTYTGTLVNNAAGGVVCSGAGSATLSGGANLGTTVGFTAGTIVPGGTCTITQSVTATSTNTNATTAPTSTVTVPTLTGAAATGVVLTVGQAGLTKAFGAASVDDGVSTTLVYTLTNSAGNPAQSGIGFTETLPLSLRFSGATLGVAYGAGCSGPATVTATGSPLNTFPIAGVAMAAATASCTVTIGVAGAGPGVTNVVGTTGTCPAVNQTNDSTRVTLLARLTNNIGAGPCLGIAPLPTLTKSFGANPQTIGVGQTATLTFTINNTAANTVNRTALGFTDTLPGAGALTAVTTTPQCGGATVAVSGVDNNIITVSGAVVNAGTSCTITATVTGVTAGSYINGPTNSSISGVSANLINGVTDQTLNVRQAGLTKVFGAASVDAGVSTTLVYTLTNGTGNPAQSGIGFTETLPSSLRFSGATLAVAYGAGCAGGPATVTATGSPLNTFTIAGIPMAAATASCTVTIGVAGAGPGVTNVVGTTGACAAPNQTNDSTKVTALARLTNNIGAGPCLGIVPLPILTKAFGSATVAVSGTTTLVFTITNTAAGNIARAGLSFTDTLQAGIQIANPTAPSSLNCGAPAFTAVNATQPFGVSAISVAAGATCTITLTVRGVTAGVRNNTNTDITAINALLTNGVTLQTLNVFTPPTVTKTFTPSTIGVGGTSSMVITVTNPAANPADLTGVIINDTYTGTLVNNAAGGVVCSGAGSATLSGGANLGTTVGFTAGTIVPGGTCTITQSVTATSTNTNATTAPTAAGPVALTGTAATGVVLTVVALPTISKAFGAGNIALNGATSLNITVTNPNAGTALSGLNFTDTLPAGLTAVNGTTPTCGGSLVVSGTNLLTFTGGSLAASANCVISVTVTGTTVGAKNNTTTAVGATGPVVLTGAVSNTATVNVYTAPTLTKAFGAAIDTGNSTTLTFTFANPAANPGTVSGIAVNDTFPTSPGAMTLFNGVVGGTCTATVLNQSAGAPAAGNTGLQISGISLNAGASCTVIVNVTAIVAGSYNNTTTAITATTPVALSGATANDILSVQLRPVLTKAFSTANIGVGQTTTLTFTIDNSAASTVNRTGLGFTDSLPGAGALTAVATTPQCGGATVGVSGANNNIITVSGAAVNAGLSCTITATVTGVTPGSYVNGPTNSSITGVTANLTNSVVDQTLNVRQASVAKTFGTASINDGATTTLVFTLSNGAGNPAQSGIALGDTLPNGLRFDSATPAVTYSTGCSGPANAAYDSMTRILSGISSVAMTGGTATCTVTISGLTNSATQTNASCTGNPAPFTNLATNVTTTRATNTSTDQCLVVAQVNPTLTKAWSTANIADGATTNLVFTLTNAGTNPAQSGISFTESLPASLRFNSGAPIVTFGAGCAGSANVVQGAPDTIAFSGVTMSALTASCTITVAAVTNRAGLLNTNCGANPAAFTNGSSNILPFAGVVNGVTSQCLVVNSIPPVLTKAWGTASIVDGNSTTLVFTLANTGTNPAQSGIAFTESLPSGLRFTGAAPGVAFGPGCSGSSTVTQGAPDTIALSGVAMTNGTLNCTITVTGVTNRGGQVNASCGASPAAFTNDSGNITSPTNVTNSVTSQCLAVTTQVPTIAKAFSPTTISASAPSTITLMITNPNSVALTSAAFTDTLTNMRVSGAQNAGGTCVGAATNTFANNQTGSLSFSGLTIPATGSCTVTVVITSSTPGMLPNATSGVSSAEAATGAVSNTATLTVNAAAPTIVKSFVTPSIALGGTSQIDFTITNPNATPLTGAAFSDTLTNMFIHATGAATGSCAGAGTNSFTVNQTGLLNVTGLTIPANGSCTVSIVVRSNTPGTLPNFATGVTSNEAPAGVSSATVNLTVTAVAPTITKTFLTNPIASGASSTLQITISNTNAGPITVTTVTDTFPTTPGVGVVRAATPNAATSCASGVVTSNATSVTLTGGTVPAGGSCTFQIDVTAATAGMYANTIAIGALTSNAGSNAIAANATLNVTPVANVAVTKSAPATIAWGTTITYTVVVSNAGPDAANLTVFSDNVPAAVTAVGASCGIPTGGAVCGSVNVTGNGVTSTITTLPSGGSVTFTITGTVPQSGTLSNFATAIVPAGISDPDDPTRIGAGNNTSATVMTVVQAPDLRITKTASSASFTVGVNASFTLTPSNAGSLATSGTVTVIDTLPAGLTYVAAGSGGTGWTCTPSGQVITCTSVTAIGAGGSGNTIIINVQVLSNASPGITNSANISGGNEPAINTGNNNAVLSLPVGVAAINTFSTDGALTGLPGASVLYTHTFSAGLSGTVSFASIHTPSPNIIGWTVQIYRDNNCNAMMDGVDGVTEITGSGIAVTAGQQICIIVKSNIPASAALGALDIISVTASFTPAVGPVVTYTRVDVTTVGAAQGAGLALSKSVRNVTLGGVAGTANTARPGDVLEYAIRYSNSSNSPLSTIALADVTPAFTTFVSATCVMPLPNNITACTATTAPSVGAAGSIQWTVTGALLPGQTGTVQFRVTVQ